MSGQLKITLRRSGIGCLPRQREVLRGLGLRRIGTSVLRPDSPAIRGMVTKVFHLVEVETVTGREATGRDPAGPPPKRGRSGDGDPDDEGREAPEINVGRQNTP